MPKALDVGIPCPKCGAPVGERCHSKTGRVTDTHEPRRTVPIPYTGDPERPLEEWETRGGKKMRGHRCKGKSRQHHGQCERRAAAGRDHCAFHGGNQPKSIARGRVRAVELKTEKFLAKRKIERTVTDPLAELARVAGEIVEFKDVLRGQVDALNGQLTYWTESDFTDAAGEFRTTAVENLRAVLTAYERALDRTAAVLASMVKLDLQGRMVALREDQAQQLVTAIRLGLSDVDMEQAVRTGAQEAIARRLEDVASVERTEPIPIESGQA
jgi:hypothetical protein